MDPLKRLFDVVASVLGLIVTGPVLLFVTFLVWVKDRHSPFYISQRVGRSGQLFKMVKLRSMVIGADLKGGSSTSNDDPRITSIGHVIRRYKLDELTQLWNVIVGDMSLVGPRPQVQAGVDMYTVLERDLLSVRPGITDFASIVFADEGAILAAHHDSDAAYDQLIRPGKSRLGLFYIENRSLYLDFCLIWLTLLTIISREDALHGVVKLLQKLNAPSDLIRLASRQEPLILNRH